MNIITIKVTGVSPLMMHADTFANPLHPATRAHKALTSKRKKTDEDYEEIARSEFIGGCYWSKEEGFYIPGQNFDAAFIAGAKLSKLGVHWKRGAVVVTDRTKLLFDGPKTPSALWEDPRFIDCRGVKVGMSKLMRYRPIFSEWSALLEVAVNDEVLNPDEAKKAISDAGRLIGVCEYRPRFGRFEVAFNE